MAASGVGKLEFIHHDIEIDVISHWVTTKHFSGHKFPAQSRNQTKRMSQQEPDVRVANLIFYYILRISLIKRLTSTQSYGALAHL